MSSRTHLTLSHEHSLWTMCHQTRVQGLALGGQWSVLEVWHRHTALLGPSQLLGQRAAVLCARQTHVLSALSLWTAFRQGSTDGRAGDFGRKRSAFRLRLRRTQHPGCCLVEPVPRFLPRSALTGRASALGFHLTATTAHAA